ncbi:hypothetical protein BSL82_10110 [Tardibacter chloracetimidivorans]|uniref:Terminase n=1 Tax=Tardibacter chloracetimidivorans TaxID=1921510 RepID=A0A1L3ZVH8_9SPHN|nr:hypothetical protein [Tardibacter chloracetimidivorans]API59627.1 hypothetical protein BSL82_10110 [Tardibacter chloracetimidivorans]
MTVKRTPEKEIAFLAALASTCSVAKACKAAGIESRNTVYTWRAEDPDFARRWEEAKKLGADVLEDEAVRRAHDGTEEPVFYQGEATGTIQRYSDTLLIFLLKGAKPDVYKDRVAAEHSGPNGGPIEVDDAAALDRVNAILSNIAPPKDDISDLC